MVTLMNRALCSSLIFCGEPGFVMDNLLRGHVLDTSFKIQSARRVGQYSSNQNTIEFELELVPFKDPIQQNTLMDFVVREGKFGQVKFCIDGRANYTFFNCLAVDFHNDKFLRFTADHYTVSYV